MPFKIRRSAGVVAALAALASCGSLPVASVTITTSMSMPVAPSTSTTSPPSFTAPDCSLPPRSDDAVVFRGDRIPLMRVGAVSYRRLGVVLPTASAGPVVAHVCRADDQSGLRDGDGPFPPGTELHAVAGYDPRFRLGVVEGPQLVVMESIRNDAAVRGRDIVDLTSGVTAIEFREASDPTRLYTTWTEAGSIATVVDALHDGPAVPSNPSPNGVYLQLVFVMVDGTTVETYVDLASRMLTVGIGLPEGIAMMLSNGAASGGWSQPSAPTKPIGAPPPTTASPPVEERLVRRLADALGVVGTIELLDGEHGQGSCINRLGPAPMLCVDVPLWGLWQYADIEAQMLPSATEDEARAAASGLLERLGLPTELGEIGSNGAQITVAMRAGGSVVVAEGGRIAQVIAPTSMLPPG